MEFKGGPSMKRLEKLGLILCICYLAAYILAAGIDNFRTKNEYEKQKMQTYERMYYNERGIKQ